ncbi:MAG: LuxR family transcriptional regulator [Arthrobacter sp.]
MIQKLLRLCLGLFLAGNALAFPSPAVAGEVAGVADSGVTFESLLAPPQEGLSSNGTSSPPSVSPSNPVDSGTGETADAKEARVDYAPYVIGGIVAVTLVASALFRRKRRVSHPSRPG